MNTIRPILLRAVNMLFIMTLLCGIIYPLLITGISQLFFKDKANGSLIEVNGVKYGSELLGQQYGGDNYLWGRIMNINTDLFTDTEGNALMYAGPSNISPAGEKYQTLIEERVDKIRQSDPDTTMDKIPVDLVTISGSGMDPHISVAAAEYQIKRIAQTRNMTEDKVRAIIDQYTTGRFAGIFGERVVNVLKVNLALDGILQ
ncbi:potassium-transporting ATPase subunit KdpC [Anaerocolumna sedimenticola]|uniref:Potassium-transporting ATPase KdpC subunit n=1 Tax=Anaerocolumna sedimenticola TaxID=2696063 RepID=A0A6P1TII3_9FIRM|nr:potassium-transporting ATPase subunit KdpC [Anaerocolumna sedimenticola]QHQ60107.1 potassium-transporting ATPase subunit KdpC [Anaerocolumna sedimenticola]